MATESHMDIGKTKANKMRIRALINLPKNTARKLKRMVKGKEYANC